MTVEQSDTKLFYSSTKPERHFFPAFSRYYLYRYRVVRTLTFYDQCTFDIEMVIKNKYSHTNTRFIMFVFLTK